MTYPKVSIVIPSYKPGHFEQCLKSAIGQTYLNTEILVSDNCPTEEIRDICTRYASLGVIYQRSSVYREHNVIAALASAKGEFIKPLFDDDLLHPFCIERMVAAMQMHDSIEVVFSASQVINSHNSRVETRRPYEASGLLSGTDLHRQITLGMHNFIGEFTTVMFRRQTMWNVGWYEMFKLGDHDFLTGLADLIAYINLAKNGTIFYVDEELSYFRRDPRLPSNSNPATNPNFGNCVSDWIDLLRVSHSNGMVTDQELRAMESRIDNFSRMGVTFPQVSQAYQRYQHHCAGFAPATSAVAAVM
jgi:glycosyltransferase involved in cell wall biosynthesis